MTTFLFLDFDGVINNRDAERRNYIWPAWHPKAGTCSRVKWVSRDLIEKVEELRAYADADVVISSTWRHHYGLGELCQILSPIPPERIIGITPTLSRSLDSPFPDAIRGQEIEDYLRRDPCDRYVILDDYAKEKFLPDQHDKLIQTDKSVGIADENIVAAKKCLDSQAREVKV